MVPAGKKGAIKRVLSWGVAIAIFLTIIAPLVYSLDYNIIREAASPEAHDLIMADGPFYISGDAYYTLDIIEGNSRETRVYSEDLKEVKGRTARKVLAVRDMKYILIADPLFYAPGNHELLIEAGEYDIQNTRNVAEISDLTPEEREKLEEYFEHYRDLMKDLAEVSKLTGDILYPENSLEIKDDWTTFSYDVTVDESNKGHYSYEGFEDLIDAYEKVVEDYRILTNDIREISNMRGFVGQDQFNIQLNMLDEHADDLEVEVFLRAQLIYALGLPSLCGPSFLLLFALVPLILWTQRRAIPHAITPTLLPLAIFIAIASAATIPTPAELYEATVEISEVPVYMDTQPGAEIDEGLARNILEMYYNFPYIMQGEIVTIRGPYYYYTQPYYLFEIAKDAVPSGLVLVEAESMVAFRNQQMAFDISKAARVAATLERDPIYASKSALDVKNHLKSQLAGMQADDPVSEFVEQEIENLETGAALEKALIERPDVKTLNELNDNLLEGYIILTNIERTTSTEEANEITNGFIVNIPRIEAISIISSGPTAEEYYIGKKSRYLRRSLVKVPTLEGLAMLGEPPTKGYFLSYYLTKDTIQDNVLVYREATGGREFIKSYMEKWREMGDGT
ncbi:hypothetical protein KKA03_07130 [archaeon]|nr:hypothetical protein [archaeon]